MVTGCSRGRGKRRPELNTPWLLNLLLGGDMFHAHSRRAGQRNPTADLEVHEAEKRRD